MSEPTGNALATSAYDRGVGMLPLQVRQALELKKQLNIAAAEMANLSWGKTLDTLARRAIADFCQTYNLDAATEIYILGGNVYLNGRFYLRKLGEMVDAQKIVYAYADFIHADARLDKLVAKGDAWASEENTRRQQQRIMHDVDDNAISACVFRVMPVGIEREITGCKAIYADDKDPVGQAKPAETVVTRACRRAMVQLVSHVPEESRAIVAIEEAAKHVSGIVQERVEHNAPMMGRRAIPQLTTSGEFHEGDPEPEIGDDGRVIVPAVTVTSRTPALPEPADTRTLDEIEDEMRMAAE